MKKYILLAIAVLFYALSSNAQKAEFFSPEGKAIKGFDVVAFYKDSMAVKGASSYTYQWKGANWFFANKQNMELFMAMPEKYAPQYGGYCAYGTAGGYKAPTETDTWTIVNGKLYFNYNKKVKESWNKNQATLIQKADTNWVKIKTKE